MDEIGLLKVGPRSAGSHAGPAAYGLGGTEATVTDADLLLGYLDPRLLRGRAMPLDGRRRRGPRWSGWPRGWTCAHRRWPGASTTW